MGTSSGRTPLGKVCCGIYGTRKASGKSARLLVVEGELVILPNSFRAPGDTARGDPRARVESGPRLRRRVTGVVVLLAVDWRVVRIEAVVVGVSVEGDGEFDASFRRFVDSELLTGVDVFEPVCRT